MAQSGGARIATRRVYDGRVVKLDVDTIRTPDDDRMELEIVRHPGAAAVVPLLDGKDAADPSVLLIHQYRYAAGGPIWEIPAGVLEPGEDPETCAHRELREETGAVAERIELLTSVLTTPGFTDEVIHLFVATGIRTGPASTERDEFIRPEARPMSRVLQMIRDGEIRDGKSVVALLYLAGFTLNL
jgi:ADP-ribose pyrophosphatase